MGAMFKRRGVTRVLAAVCVVRTVCAPFAGAYVAYWVELATATHR